MHSSVQQDRASSTGAVKTEAEIAQMQEPDCSGRIAMDHHTSKARPQDSTAGTANTAAMSLGTTGCAVDACKAAGKESSGSQGECSEMQPVEVPVHGSGSTGVRRPQGPEQGGGHDGQAGAAWAEGRAEELRDATGEIREGAGKEHDHESKLEVNHSDGKGRRRSLTGRCTTF